MKYTVPFSHMNFAHKSLDANFHKGSNCSLVHCSKLGFQIKSSMGSHNSNVSNFGDAATKPWIDCFDYTMEVPHIPQHYKHYTSPSTLSRPKQHPPEKPPTA